MVLVRLNNDEEDVESVWELFYLVNNICGEVDVCLVFFVILKEDILCSEVCDFFIVFFRGLDRLFNFIMVLNKF